MLTICWKRQFSTGKGKQPWGKKFPGLIKKSPSQSQNNHLNSKDQAFLEGIGKKYGTPRSAKDNLLQPSLGNRGDSFRFNRATPLAMKKSEESIKFFGGLMDSNNHRKKNDAILGGNLASGSGREKWFNQHKGAIGMGAPNQTSTIKRDLEKQENDALMKTPLWQRMSLSNQTDRQNVIKQKLRIDHLMRNEGTMGESKAQRGRRFLRQGRQGKSGESTDPKSNAIAPEHEHVELQKFMTSLTNTAPLLEELMVENPFPTAKAAETLSPDDAEMLKTFSMPITQRQVEHSLSQEFESPISATNWGDYHDPSPSLLQAAVLYQTSKNAGAPVPVADVAMDSEELQQLIREAETGDYTRYNSPSILLSCMSKEGEQSSNHRLNSMMLFTAYHLGCNFNLSPGNKQKVLSQVYALASKA